MKPHTWEDGPGEKVYDDFFEKACLVCGVVVTYLLSETTNPVWDENWTHPEPEDCDEGVVYMIMTS